MLPRELGKPARTRPTRHWPRRAAHRSGWLSFCWRLFLWAYEALALWDSPLWTAWIVLAYFVGAFMVDDAVPRRELLQVRLPDRAIPFRELARLAVRSAAEATGAVCATCVTHDCLRGNDRQRGCELDLFLPRKAGNMDCTFCLDCVRACPHDNVGILATIPGSDLWSDRLRSSIGLFSQRPDLAALALVVVVGGFAGAAAMVAPAWVRSPSTVVGRRC